MKNNFQRAQAVLQQHSHHLITLILILQVLIILYWRMARGYWPLEFYVSSWSSFAPPWAESLYTLRWLVRFLQIALLAVLAFAEWRAQSLSLWIRKVASRPIYLVFVIGLMAFALFSYFLQPGNIGTADAYGHMPSAWLVQQSWQEGWPFVFWSNYADLGVPALQFHNSSYYYLVAIIGYLGISVNDAYELSLFLISIASAYFVFLFVKQLTHSRLAALSGTAAWCASFYQYHVGIDLARLPACVFMALMPVQFYFTQRLLRAKVHQLPLVVMLGLVTGALIWIHSLYGVLAIGLGLLYSAFGLMAQYRPSQRHNAIRTIAGFGLAYLLGLLVAAYQILPTIIEWPQFNTNSEGVPFRLATSAAFTLDSVTNIESWYGGYLGNTLSILGLLGVIASLLFRYRPGMAVSALLASLVIIAFDPFNSWIASMLQPFPLGVSLFTVLSYRLEGFLMFIVLTLAVLTGVAVHLAVLAMRRLERLQWHSLLSRERIALVVIMIVIVESLYFTLQINRKFPDVYVEGVSDLGQLYDVLAQQPDLDKRVLNLQTGANTSFMIPMLSGHPGLFGHGQDTSPATMRTLQAILTNTERDVQAGGLSPETLSLLNQTNIGYVISDAATSEVDGLQKLASTAHSILWQVTGSLPLTLVTDATAAQPLGPQVNLVTHRETNNTVYLEFDSPVASFAQLAYAYYPYLDVRLDGVVVPISPTSLSLIGLPVSEGRHVIEIKPILSPVRQWTLALGLIMTALLLIYGFVVVRRFGWRVL